MVDNDFCYSLMSMYERWTFDFYLYFDQLINMKVATRIQF